MHTTGTAGGYDFLVVLGVDFEVGLGVGAGGAQLGGLDTHDDVTAVAAFPNGDFALGKDFSGLHVLQQGAVTLLVVLLNGGDHAELGGQGMEALFVSGLGKAFVHVGPFVVLALSSGQQVLGGIADAVQLLEPQLGVLLLVISGLQEQGCDLLVAFLLGLGCKISVLVPGLGFTGEGSH